MEESERAFRARAERLFARARFLDHVGIRLVGLGRGWAETTLAVDSRHSQSQGFVHAGVQATMADHTAGAASGTVVGEGQVVLTVEMKLNLLRPAAGEALRCRAEVVRAGKSLVFCEARVFARAGEEEKLVSTFSSTLAVVPEPP